MRTVIVTTVWELACRGKLLSDNTNQHMLTGQKAQQMGYAKKGGYYLLSSVVYFDPETARDSVDCGMCLGARFDEWVRFAL